MEISQKNGKPVSASRATIAQLMQPEHANNLGNVHGGRMMELVDEAGTLACMRHAQQRVEVPPLITENEEQHQRTDEGKVRQVYCLAPSKRREAKYG